ncbi:hypothetical protein V8E53_014294 [Lactarius tabidus]
MIISAHSPAHIMLALDLQPPLILLGLEPKIPLESSAGAESAPARHHRKQSPAKEWVNMADDDLRTAIPPTTQTSGRSFRPKKTQARRCLEQPFTWARQAMRYIVVTVYFVFVSYTVTAATSVPALAICYVVAARAEAAAAA